MRQAFKGMAAAVPGFLSLLLLTMANYMLSPMCDAAALAVGISHIPTNPNTYAHTHT